MHNVHHPKIYFYVIYNQSVFLTLPQNRKKIPTTATRQDAIPEYVETSLGSSENIFKPSIFPSAVQVSENISSKMLSENSITPTLKIQFHFVSFSLFVKILKNSVLIFSIAILRIAVCQSAKIFK